MADERAYTAGHFALDLMGASAGYIKKFDGLDMEAGVVTDDLGAANVPKKHVANIRWTPAKARIGIGMANETRAIVQRAFAAEQKPFNGALHLADANNVIQSSLTFTGAIMTSVTIPKLDAASREPGYFDLEWEAEQVRWVKGNSAALPTATAQKAWLCSNFRFEMGGLPCNRVASIDSFTWRCAIVRDPTGAQRPATMTVPNIKVEISMADFDKWLEAANKWFIEGVHEERNEMSGAIVFLATDLQSELGRVTLKNCGFAKFMHGPFDASATQIARFSCEFYVEKMEFAIK